MKEWKVENPEGFIALKEDDFDVEHGLEDLE